MKKFEFSIIASGLDPAAEDFEQRFYDAGCDDAPIHDPGIAANLEVEGDRAPALAAHLADPADLPRRLVAAGTPGRRTRSRKRAW